MTMLRRKRVLAAKIETTAGTAESLTASEASFNAWDIQIQNEIVVEEREGQGAFGYLAGVPGGYIGRVTFKTDCGWDGTATEPSWADTFLPACGVVKSSQTFTPRTEVPGSNVKTLTIGVYQDGTSNALKKVLRGCAGTFKMVCPTGRMAYIEWDFMGVWVAPVDATMLSGITYPTALPLRYATSTTTFNSVALCVENITLDCGNTVVLRECASTVSGYDYAIITNRNPKITANPEAKLVATRDVWGQLLASTEASITWDLDGPTNSALTISAPKAQVIRCQEGERTGLVTDEIEWQCNKNASTADQEFSMLFTAAS